MTSANYTTKYLAALLMGLLPLTFTAPKMVSAQNKPTIAIVEFAVKARGVDRSTGAGMSEILTSALFDTDKYRLIDRSSMEQLLAEQKRVLEGAIDPETGAQIGKILGAQYLIFGTLTKFSEKEKRAGFGGLIKRKVGVGLVTFESEIGFSLKIIDATTGELMAVETVDKKKKSTGIAAGGLVGGWPVGGIVYKSKSMENALEESIREAVGKIDAQLPEQIFVSPAAPFDPANCTALTGLTAPKIMVVIPEVHISRPIPDPAGETEIIRQFLEANFNLVDQKQIAAIRDQERVLNAAKDPALAVALGLEFGADIVVIGEAFSEMAGRRPNGMISCRARVEARAIATRTGKILVADGKHASGLDIAENVAAKTALKNAGGQIARYFMQQLCEKAGNPEPELTSTEILLANTNMRQLLTFQKLLETLTGVQKIEKKLTGKAGRLFVEYSGSTEALAEEIILAQPQDFPFEITSFAAGKIDVNLTNQVPSASADNL